MTVLVWMAWIRCPGVTTRPGSADRRPTAAPPLPLRLAPRRAERVERLGQRELLADEARHQAAAADLAAHLQPAVDADQIAPAAARGPRAPGDRGRRRRSAAGTGARTPRCGRPRAAAARARAQAGPTARSPCARPARRRASARACQRTVAPRARFCRDERAQPGEAVAGDAARGAQLPERVLDLAAAGPAGPAESSSKKDAPIVRSAPSTRARGRREAASSRLSVAARRAASGRSRRRASAIGAALVGVTAAVARREPPPHHLAREAELVEPRRLVAGDARGQHLASPRRPPPARSPGAAR